MKYILIIGDGMADNAVPELNGKTPLEVAEKPFIDGLCKKSLLGHVLTVPSHLPAGSDTAILSIFGCDPSKYFTGRSPLEAAGCGFAVPAGAIGYRCNMVAMEDCDKPFAQRKILSHNGGSVEGDQSMELIQWLFAEPEFAAKAKELGLSVFPTPSFRHIVTQEGGSIHGFVVTPPHDILGQVVGNYTTHGNENADKIWALMALANEKLDHHPVNEGRRAAGHLPANGIWLWAEGTSVQLPNFVETYGKDGSVISAVPLVHGIGSLAGLKPIHVEGATGETETNYEGKVDAAINALHSGDDFVCIHIEAPDEATHAGNLEEKLISIGYLDSRVVKPLVEKLDALGEDYRILMLSDHKTLMTTRTHDGEPVPFMVYDSTKDQASGYGYTEAGGEAGIYVAEGHTLPALLFDQK
ncbi:MAG: 2,3-bisphosphoglycerate-independent phosphoglycerate mutase [Eubacteriales bacterium]